MQAYGRSNMISAKNRPREDNSLQRIYGNIDDLVGLEEQQINNLINQREEEEIRIKGHRMASDKRMNGLENIYLNKQASLNASSRQGYN
jgi:regulator of sirC expression with transglutaminase-like and TPR domain